jgi:hypothetical protein
VGAAAEPTLVRGAVQIQQGLIDHPLLVGGDADDLRRDHLQHALNRLGDALAAVAVATVAQFHGLVLTGGRARWNGGPREAAIGEHQFHLDRGITTRIEDLPCAYLDDFRHVISP